jgi:hypothetical protein
MELKVNIGYKELLNLIWQLPVNQLARLRGDIMHERSPKEINHKSFQALILNGPTMDDNQFESFQANRQHFDQWRSD